MRQFILLLILAAACVQAQSTDAILSGTLTDPSGAVVNGAKVIARHARTGVVTQTTTNESGVYLFPALPPGPYQVTAELRGFRKFVYNDVVLEIGARINLNMEMEVGTLAESVEVTAEAETSLGYIGSAVGGMVTGQKVLDLPLTARNALGLVYITRAWSGTTSPAPALARST